MGKLYEIMIPTAEQQMIPDATIQKLESLGVRVINAYFLVGGILTPLAQGESFIGRTYRRYEASDGTEYILSDGIELIVDFVHICRAELEESLHKAGIRYSRVNPCADLMK